MGQCSSSTTAAAYPYARSSVLSSEGITTLYRRDSDSDTKL